MANLANEGLLDEVFVQDKLDVLEDGLNCVGSPLVATYQCKICLDQLEHLGSLLCRAT
jgi:hypothetical protein